MNDQNGERIMSGGSVRVLLTSGRTLGQGRAMEKGKMTDDYQKAVAVCELDTASMESLGIKNGDPITIQTEHGQTVVWAKHNKNLEPGVAFVPAGPYFNLLLGSYTQSTGMPGFKSLSASITSTPDASILSLVDLSASYKEVRE